MKIRVKPRRIGEVTYLNVIGIKIIEDGPAPTPTPTPTLKKPRKVKYFNVYSFVVPLLLDQLMIHLNNDGNLRKALEIDTLVLKLKYRRSRGVAVNNYPAVVVPAKIL